MGWLNNPNARPSFTELEAIMHNFIKDSSRYILTIVSVPLLCSFQPIMLLA